MVYESCFESAMVSESDVANWTMNRGVFPDLLIRFDGGSRIIPIHLEPTFVAEKTGF